MDGHTRRREVKMKEIKAAALALFNRFGIQKVSVDEIAQESGVSKVTIYKYFESKENLVSVVTNELFDKIIQDTRALVMSDGDFLKKLSIIIDTKIKSFAAFQGELIQEMFSDVKNPALIRFNTESKKLMYEFYDQGKAQGYVDKNIDNGSIYLHSEIFNQGIQKVFEMNPEILRDEKLISEVINLFFKGFILDK